MWIHLYDFQQIKSTKIEMVREDGNLKNVASTELFMINKWDFEWNGIVKAKNIETFEK